MLPRLRVLYVYLVGFLTSSSATRLSRQRVPRLTFNNFKCCHTETEWGDHDFSLCWSQYTGTDSTSRKREPGAGIEPMTSRPGE